ncbi:MAG TPA: phosphoribosyltransferase [Nitrospiraceae bacterium]|nr:phosphoribosyltransferase [Nitrospiraceae bacterium]
MFRDRREAGRVLAGMLTEYRDLPDVIVLGLPRGGVPVAFEVAVALQAPLDVMIVRKLGVPGHEELAMGAIASGGVQIINDEIVRYAGITAAVVASVAADERMELVRRERTYRGERAPLAVEGRIAILIDDGLATGSTMRAAVTALRAMRPARIVAAVPVAPLDTCTALQADADEVVCAMTPSPFYGVGQWYDDFAQTTDGQVRDLLEKAATASIDLKSGTA